MSIEKYIFDPANPKKCRSCKLLLNIAKKEPLVYVSSDFITIDYEKEILGNDFNGEFWDILQNYESLDVFEKVEVFKEQLSKKDYYNYIDTLEIDEDKFTYKKIFENFFDCDINFGSVKYSEFQYDSQLLKDKLQFKQRHNASYHYLNESSNGPKIVFDNNDFKYLIQSKKLFDVASILVTHIDNKDVFSKYNVHKNLKPLYLQKLSDVKLLLNVLQEDLKKEKNKSMIDEEISTIDTIKIKNFYSIKNLYLENLADKKEIYIVGENGDGKTLFLQALVLGLKGVEEGEVFDLAKTQKESSFEVISSNKISYMGKEEKYKNLFAYGANRNNNCQMKVDETGYLTLFDASLDLKNPVDWLKYLDHSEKAEKTNVVSVKQAVQLIQELLDSDVEIEITPDKVIFSEKGSVVSFEQLSAGYRGVITIVSDLLVRLSDNQSYVQKIEDFKGVVIIDEVELHLHPKWKYSFVDKIRTMFPNIQFIMTTHSPTVLLGASADAVFYKIYKENGEVTISNQIKNEGYTNNTLVSSPLFDLETVTSKNYDKNVSNDDFIYEKIHQTIAQKIKDESLTDKERIAALIEEELAKI